MPGLRPGVQIQQLLQQSSQYFMLIDEKVFSLYFSNDQIEKPLLSDRIYKANALEQFKTIDGVLEVVNFLSKHSFNRGNKLIVVGGGIIQDVGAFVSAIYQRGVKRISIPTTLLAMSDVCIGGKTGLNYLGLKNQLALISPPEKVIIHTGFLSTLSAEDIKSGLGEILKMMFLGGEDCLKFFKTVNPVNPVNPVNTMRSIMRSLICISLKIKKAVIEADELEKNIRKSLNYGHTFGHMIESLSEYKISHGKAVLLGMIAVNKLFTPQLSGKHEHLIRSLLDDSDFQLLQPLKQIDCKKIKEVLLKDKKSELDQITFVCLNEVGKSKLHKVVLTDSFLDSVKNILSELSDL